MIMIRADGNPAIATGHLMRTLTIAKECVKRNVPVCFLLADGESERVLKELYPEWENCQCHIIVLASDYRHPEDELPVLCKLLEREKPRALLVDSYFVTEAYLKELGKHTRIFYLDDFKEKDWPVDVIINYDPITPAALPTYQSAYRTAGKRLLGASYAPLREQFRTTQYIINGEKEKSYPPLPEQSQAVKYQVREKIAEIMITAGGADENNITGKILDAVLSVRDPAVTVHVVVGVLNRHREQLREKAGQQIRVVLHEGLRDMAGLMKKCDLAFTAAGTTLYELCAVGVPAVCFALADNQVSCAEGFAAAGAVIYEKEGRFQEQLTRLAGDAALRRQLSAAMRQLVDGQGAARIVDELLASVRYSE